MSRTDKDKPWRIDQPPRMRSWYNRPPSKRVRIALWTAPDRRRVAMSLKSVAREYRATGDVETIPSTQHHRHAPISGWWN